MKQVNVLVIGDADRRAQVKAGLQGQRHVRLAGEIAEFPALRLVPQLQADVIVLDFGAAQVNGLAALPWLAALPGAPAVIVLGASGSPAERRLALELGASSYLPPGTAAQALGPLVAAPPQPTLPLAQAA
jgi:DNA-binding NarL/FixJ family response regulator